MDTSFLRLISMALKILELGLAFIYIGIITSKTMVSKDGQTGLCGLIKVTSFIIIASAFVIPTFLLLIVHIHKRSYDHQRKSIFELLYNVCAVIFLAVVSSTLLSYSELFPAEYRNHYKAGGVLGLANAVFYSASTVLSFITLNVD